GDVEGAPKRGVSLFDMKTATYRPLEGDLQVIGWFSADSQTVAIPSLKDDHATAIQMIDVATGTVRKSLPIDEPLASIRQAEFSPDGASFARVHNVLPRPRAWAESSSHLIIRDLKSDTDVMKWRADDQERGISMPRFTPDGRTLLVLSGTADGLAAPRLLIFD